MSLEENLEVFVLPLDTLESPAYISCFGNGGNVQLNEENHGHLINNIPGMIESLNGYENEIFHPCWANYENEKLTIDKDMAQISDFEMSLVKYHRHIRIVIPSTFLQSGALTMGQVQTSHPFVPPVFKLKNAIDYLISPEGIAECWGGERKGDPIPDEKVSAVDDGEGGRKKKTARRPEDKFEQHDRVALIPKGAAENGELQYYFNYGKAGEDETDFSTPPPVEVNIHDLMMRLVENEETIVAVPRVRVYYEVIPQNDPGFKTDNPIQIPASQLFDRASEFAAVVFHYVFLDPRLDPMKGLLRIWKKSLGYTDQQREYIDQKDKMRGKLAEAEAHRYCISPSEYVDAVSIMAGSYGKLTEPDFKEPLAEKIFRSELENGKIDITVILHISNKVPFTDYARVQSRKRTHDGNGAKTMDAHPQLVTPMVEIEIETKINQSILIRSLNQAEELEMSDLQQQDENADDRIEVSKHLIYCFPVPTRVVYIPPNLVHPVIFNNCLLPHLSNSPRNKKKLLVYTIPDDRLHKDSMFNFGTLMLPKLEIGCKSQLTNHIREKRGFWQRMDRKSKSTPLFLMDILRMKHGAVSLDADIDCAIKPNQSTPIEVAREISENLQNDLMSDEPNAPVPMVKMAEYIKLKKKEDPNWSMFCNVYKDLHFKDFEGLTCCSSYLANIYHILDIAYAVKQSHKLFVLIMVVCSLTMKFNFKDQFYLLFMGDPDSGKSWAAKLFFTLFSIPGTYTDNNNESAQVVNNINRKMVGMVKFKDDGDSNITTGPNENNANNSIKSAISSGKTSRAVVNMDKPQGERVDDQAIDSRLTTVCCKNGSKEDMPPSILTRVLIMYVRLFKRLLNTAQSEQRRDNLPSIGGDALPIYREKFQTLIGKNFQLFQGLVWYFIRGGGILYSSRENEKKASRDAFERFVNAVTALLKQNIRLSMRMQAGQLFPLMEGFMILRVWAHINSGSIKDPTSHLRPGAPFNFEFLQELSDRGLLLPIQEDLMMAISYLDPIFSHEIIKEIVIYIKTNIENGTGAITEADKKRLSFTDFKNWTNYERIFFQEQSVVTGAYETNFDWIDLGKICDLQNMAMDENTIIENLAMNIKTRMGEEIFSINDLQQAILNMLSEREEDKIDHESYCKVIDQTTNVHAIKFKIDGTGFPVMFCSSIMKSVMQVPKELQAKGIRSRHLLIRSEYIRNYISSSGNSQDVTSVSNPDFVGSTAEHAMHYAFSYKNGPTGKVVLPGMTFDRPLRSTKYKSNPQIMKVIEMRNDREEDFFKIVNLTDNLQVGPKNFYGGSRKKNEDKKDEIYYNYETFRYLQSLSSSIKNYGLITEDGTVIRDPIDLVKMFNQKFIHSKLYKIYSPAGLEKTFEENRQKRLFKKGGSSAPDYVQSMIQFELDSAGCKFGKYGKQTEMEPIYADFEEDRESIITTDEEMDVDEEDQNFEEPPQYGDFSDEEARVYIAALTVDASSVTGSDDGEYTAIPMGEDDDYQQVKKIRV